MAKQSEFLLPSLKVDRLVRLHQARPRKLDWR
jgi:hypothetical protein